MCSAYTGPANEVGWTPWENLLQLRGFPARIQGLLTSHELLQRETGPRGETATLYPGQLLAVVEIPLPRIVPLEK